MEKVLTERIYKLPKQSVGPKFFALILGIGIPVWVLTYLEGVGTALAAGAAVLVIMVPLILRHSGPEITELLVNDAGIKLIGVDREYRVTWSTIESANLRSRSARGPVLEIKLKNDSTWDWPAQWRSNSLQKLFTESNVFIPRLASESDERDFFQYINYRIENKQK